ncbi:class I SAM-dependent methyltransferase [Phenylobacterium sp.]|uniref:class I SAM-dependent methyltransferase n=1 Tax=Phenylobacterium sp. TaxID=1871053 RepID=UPI001213B11D|nr:class I SAM-dependent methyltransferase [Phenylobacterium sp.]THD58080.1 MAG: class I SAM-dependent methyltransferase [Phenylobacterium sp.]
MSAEPPADPYAAQVAQCLHWLRDSFVNHAEDGLRQILAVAPGHPLAERLLGIALFKLGRQDEAIAQLSAAAARDADNPRVWFDLAVALRDTGRGAEAAAAYARGIEAQIPPRDHADASPPLASQAFSTEFWRQNFKVIDYDYQATVRYGAGRPAHPELARLIGGGRERYAAFLNRLGELQADFARTPWRGRYDEAEPFWLNSWFPPLDGMALTGMLRDHDPRRFVEVGSGVSTKFARRAVKLYGLRTRLTSIDPQPRNEIDRLCDEVIRQPLEACPASLFESLEPGDIFFLDSSHRSFQGSDVTVFFLEILPRLKPGVIVHIHDIYLPFDYISGHVPRLWNEQYLLATALLFGAPRFEILFPAWFVGRDSALAAHAGAVLRQGPLTNLDLYGASFWMRIT